MARLGLTDILCVVGVSSALAVGSTKAAHAQIANLHNVIKKGGGEGFSETAEGSLEMRAGNATIFNYDFASTTRYRHKEHLIFVFAAIEFQSQDKEAEVNRYLGHLRYRLSLGKLFDMEFFGQHSQDMQRRMFARDLVGIAPRLKLIDSDIFELTAGAGYMLENEKLDDKPVADANQTVLAHRLASHAAQVLHLSDRVSISHTVYFQPRFTKFSDYRLSSDFIVKTKIIEPLALKFTLKHFFDSLPPIDVYELDTTLKSSLEVEF